MAEIATVATPDTILAWKRKFADHKVDTAEPRKSVGRPRVNREIEDLVVRMARENRSWGYDRIQGTLKHLGYTISDQTVGNILKRHHIPPAPERKKTVTWREFTRSHLDLLLATDFFNGEVWSGLGLLTSCLLCLIHFSSDFVQLVGMLLHYQVCWMLSLTARALAFNVQIEKAMYSVKRMVRLRLIACGKSRCRCRYWLSFDDLREDQSQGQPNVIFLSALNPRPIRDGSVRCQQTSSARLREDDECKAA